MNNQAILDAKIHKIARACQDFDDKYELSVYEAVEAVLPKFLTAQEGEGDGKCPVCGKYYYNRKLIGCKLYDEYCESVNNWEDRNLNGYLSFIDHIPNIAQEGKNE